MTYRSEVVQQNCNLRDYVGKITWYKLALGDLRVLVQLGIYLICPVNNLGSLKEFIYLCTFYSLAHTRVLPLSVANNRLK